MEAGPGPVQKDYKLIPSDVSSRDFKSDFVWGTATSAYQIEGAAFQDGRQASIWDTFCLKNPAAITNGDNGNVATKAYYKTKEDVQRMKKMGLKAYRFSLSWTRILPGGKLSMGVNSEGVDYYNNLINELIKNDIVPYITLWHWDTPNALEDEYMGFLSERIVDDFVEYAQFCFWEFGDRVKHWITLNEPHSYSVSGYCYGTFAPGRGGSTTLTQTALESGNNLGATRFGGGRNIINTIRDGNPGTEPYIVAHNLLLTHANVVELYRQRFKESQGGTIGITLNSMFFEPLNPNDPLDTEAVFRGVDFILGWFLEPCVSGKYPDSMIKNVGDRLPEFTEVQANLLKGSFDFLGVNYYCSYYATPAPPSDVVSYATDSLVHEQPEDADGNPIGPMGGVDWFYSYPPGFYKLMLYIKEKYGDPLIYITENGWADANISDQKIEEACVDTERIEYYNAHLQNLRDAIRDGVRVEGYFAWSFMDNFEWSDGYSTRFGVFYVDFKHGSYTRYPKNSAIWFMNFLKNAEPIDEADPSQSIA